MREPGFLTPESGPTIFARGTDWRGRPRISIVTWLWTISQAPNARTLCPTQTLVTGGSSPRPESRPPACSLSPSLLCHPHRSPWSLLSQRGCHTASTGAAAPPHCRSQCPQACRRLRGAASPGHCHGLQERTLLKGGHCRQTTKVMGSPSCVRMSIRERSPGLGSSASRLCPEHCHRH